MSEKPVVRKTRIVKKRVPKVKQPEVEVQVEKPTLVCEDGVCAVEVLPETVSVSALQELHEKLVASSDSSVTEAGGDSEVLEDIVAPVQRTKRKQTKYSKEELSELYDVLLDSIETRLSEDGTDPSQKKFLRNTKKSVKDLKSGTLKIMKKSKKDKDKDAPAKPPSGLTKPVLISDEMMEFFGSDSNQKSRVDVTRALCAYVKEHDLQNPENRKEIIPDEKLAKLLNYTYDPEDPLTYCSIQKLVQRHFPRQN